MQHVSLFLCSLLARIMAEQRAQRFYWPETELTRQNLDNEHACIMNATYVGKQTSKVPTRVSFLLFSIL